MSLTDSTSVSAGSPHVCRLDDVNAVDTYCKTHPVVLLFVTVGISPRCQKLSRVFEEVGASLSASGSDVRCAEIEAVGNPVGARFGVRGYPTIILFNGPQFKLYRGSLNKDDILGYVKRQNLPVVTVLESLAALDDIKRTHDTVVVAHLKLEDETTRESFTAVATDLRDNFVFCTMNDSSDAAGEGTEVPSVVLYKKMAETRSILRNPLDAGAIRDFVKTAAQPLIMPLLPELHGQIMQQTLPLGYIFVSSSFQQQQVGVDFLSMARKYRGRVQIHSVDVNDFTDLSEDMHVELGQWPTFAIHEPSRNLKYPINSHYGGQTRLGPEEIDRFIESYLAGMLKPTIKSQPVPPTQEGSVVEVVGLSYDDVVLNPKKDVLIEYYTPWCGPCKALLPAYEQLASLYASDGKARDLVTIAKLDYEANDVPDKDIRGFPWFKLYPAGRKESPVTFAEEPRIATWTRFIAENGGHGVTLSYQGGGST